MNRPNHIRKAQTLAQKYSGKSGDNYFDDYSTTDKVQNMQLNLFDKINKIFDDPSIKDLKDFDHDEFLNKENDERDNLPPLPNKHKSKSMQSGKDVLDKAKQLLEKNKNDISLMKEKQKKKIVKIENKQSKENTFVTGLGLYQEKQEEEQEEEIQKPPITEQPKEEEIDYNYDDDDDDEDYEDLDENEYLKKLEDEEYDDLAELRKMIASTKKEIQGYVGEVQQLKNSISDLNVGYKNTGYGVDDDLFTEMDREFNRFVPGGDTNKLFDDLGNKVKNSKEILSTAGKRGVKKNNLIGGTSSISGTTGSISGTTGSISGTTGSISGTTLGSISGTTLGTIKRTQSSTGFRKPPLVRQPVLDKGYGVSSRIPELKPISNAKKTMRQTFY